MVFLAHAFVVLLIFFAIATLVMIFGDMCEKGGKCNYVYESKDLCYCSKCGTLWRRYRSEFGNVASDGDPVYCWEIIGSVGVDKK